MNKKSSSRATTMARCLCGAEAPEDKQASLCDPCFERLFVKRLRKSLKEAGWVPKNATVDVLSDNTIEAEAGYVALKQVLGELPCAIEKTSTPKGDILVLTLTANDLAALFWNDVFKSGAADLPKGIQLFSSVTTAEVTRYAGIKGIKGTSRKINAAVRGSLDKLEAKYPGIALALMKSTKFAQDVGKKSSTGKQAS